MRQLVPGTLGIGQHLVHFAFCLGVRVEQHDVDTVERKARCPSAPNNSTAKQANSTDAELVWRLEIAGSGMLDEAQVVANLRRCHDADVHCLE